MGVQFVAKLPVSVRVKDKEKVIESGKSLPDGVDEGTLSALQTMGFIVAVETPDAKSEKAEVVIDPTTLPPDSATRAVWDAFAGTVGVDPAGFPTKPDLLEAVKTAFAAKNDAGTS